MLFDSFSLVTRLDSATVLIFRLIITNIKPPEKINLVIED